jgi:hypothetical protein
MLAIAASLGDGNEKGEQNIISPTGPDDDDEDEHSRFCVGPNDDDPPDERLKR